MFYEIAELAARINALEERAYALQVELGMDAHALLIEADSLRARKASIEAEYADADSLYWETAEARGWL